MAVDPWMIDASGGAPSYTAGEARLLLVTPFVAGAGASLGVRSGVRPSGSGTDLLVQAQGSPNMSVLVNTGAVIVQGAISVTQGAYTWALDAATTLTIAAAHASLSRTDLVVVRIRDAGVDTSGQRDAAVTVITGTAGGGVPSLPTDATYLTIAQITVAAAAASIVSGNIADKRPFTAAPGGLIQCTSTTRPTGVLGGQRIRETDTGFDYGWNGSKWMRDMVRLAATADVSFTSNTTKAVIAGMSLQVEINSRYEIDGWIEVFGPQGVGLEMDVSAPSGATVRGTSLGYRDSDGVFISYQWTIANPAGAGSFGYAISTNQTGAYIRGTVITGASAGTIALRASQRVSSASTSSLLSTSWMNVTQVV